MAHYLSNRIAPDFLSTTPLYIPAVIAAPRMVQMFQATPGQHDFQAVWRMLNMRPPAVSLG